MAKPNQRHPLNETSSPSRPTVRSGSMRYRAKDGAFTPTEKLKKDRLMRQFMRTGRKGAQVSSGNSPEYMANYDLIDWGKK